MVTRRQRDDRDGQPPDAGAAGLRDAALAPALRPGHSTRVLLLLGIPILAGIGAWGVQLRDGLGVTGLSDQVFWGLYTVDLVTFIGFSYGGALVAAILRLTNASWRGPVVRLAEGTALVTLLVGAAFPIIHLGHPERVWQLVTRPQLNSPVLWDMVAIATYLLVTVLLFTLPLIPDLAALKDHEGLGQRRARWYRRLAFGWRGTPAQRESLERTVSILAAAIIPIAIMVHTVLSYAFSLTSRPGWHSTIFGPYFVLAALYSGVAIVILAAATYRRAFGLAAWIDERCFRMLGGIMAVLGAVYAYFLFTEVTTEGYVGAESAQTLLHALLLGRWAGLFWTFVALGVVAPLALVSWPRTRTVGGITTAAGLVVVALWLKRFLMVVPPLTQPLITGDVATYAPSAVEWLVTLGATAAVPFLMILLFRFVPVLAVHELEEDGAAGTAPPPVDAALAVGARP